MTDLHSDVSPGSRSAQLDRAIHELLSQAPELEAAAVVSFDGLPMAAALPASMDEDRVAAMSAALLSLGERAAQGLGRGELSQVYIEGDNGTVFLVSADDEAVLVAVASKGSKAGMMLYEVRRAAAVVAAVLQAELPSLAGTAAVPDVALAPEPVAAIPIQTSGPVSAPTWSPADLPVPHQAAAPVPAEPLYSAPVHAVPAYDLPVHAGPVRDAAYDAPAGAAPVSTPLVHEAPVRHAPVHQVPVHEAPVHEAPVYEAPVYEAPVYEAPVYEAPVYEAPVYEAPVYEAPVYELPAYLAQQYVEPTSVEPAPMHPTASAPEQVWPLYAPTSSVMPGGGVPPSTWS